MNLEHTELINVCFLPDEATANAAVGLSRAMESDDTMFVLGDGLFAHLTLFMARFPLGLHDDILARVETAIAEAPQPTFAHTGYLLTEARYFEVSYAKTLELLALQEKVAGLLAPLRYQPEALEAESYYENWREHTRENVQRTGYNLMGDLYRPHISLTRFHEGHVPQAIDAPTGPGKLSFLAPSLGVYVANDQGAVHTQLRQFSFTQ